MNVKASAVIFAALVLSGCVFRVGNLFEGAVAASYYSHREDFENFADVAAAAVDACAAGESWQACVALAQVIVEGANGTKRWDTHVGRTWGTSELEAVVDQSSERISVRSDGISDNMAGVLGEDVIEKIAKVAACHLQPLAAGCGGQTGELTKRLRSVVERGDAPDDDAEAADEDDFDPAELFEGLAPAPAE